jgi:hypothetical protein
MKNQITTTSTITPHPAIILTDHDQLNTQLASTFSMALRQAHGT